MSDPEKMKVAELRAVLQERGLDTKGTKPVLVSRLLGEDAEMMEPSPSTPRKRRLSSSSRPSTPVRRSRRISGDLEPAMEISANTKNIETIEEAAVEEIEEENGITKKTGDTSCDDKKIPEPDACTADMDPQAMNSTEEEDEEEEKVFISSESKQTEETAMNESVAEKKKEEAKQEKMEVEIPEAIKSEMEDEKEESKEVPQGFEREMDEEEEPSPEPQPEQIKENKPETGVQGEESRESFFKRMMDKKKESSSEPKETDKEKSVSEEKNERKEVEADKENKTETEDFKEAKEATLGVKRKMEEKPFEVKEHEPDIAPGLVCLDWHNSDLNLRILDTLMEGVPFSRDGWAFCYAAARATFGFTSGKLWYEVKYVDNMDVKIEKETTTYDLRVGWSTNSASLMLGEDPNSWCYSSCEGKMASDKKFEDYGEKFTKGDVVGAFIDFSQNEINVTFTKNGEDQGDAFQISKEELGDNALFPHIMTRNVKFEVNFGIDKEAAAKENWKDALAEDYVKVGGVGEEERVRGNPRITARDQCECIMLIGLPGCGKSTW